MNEIIKKTFIVTAFFLIAFSLVVFLLFIPSLNNLKKNKNLISSKESELSALFEQLNVLQKTSKNKDELNITAQKIGNYWPDSPEVSSFIVLTEELAKNNSLVIENVSIDESKISTKKTDSSAKDETDKDSDQTQSSSKKKTAELDIQFSLSTKAPYSSVMNFIEGMETLARFNTIKSLTLNGTQDNLIDLKLTGKIYYGK